MTRSARCGRAWCRLAAWVRRWLGSNKPQPNQTPQGSSDEVQAAPDVAAGLRGAAAGRAGHPAQPAAQFAPKHVGERCLRLASRASQVSNQALPISTAPCLLLQGVHACLPATSGSLLCEIFQTCSSGQRTRGVSAARRPTPQGLSHQLVTSIHGGSLAVMTTTAAGIPIVQPQQPQQSVSGTASSPPTHSATPLLGSLAHGSSGLSFRWALARAAHPWLLCVLRCWLHVACASAQQLRSRKSRTPVLAAAGVVPDGQPAPPVPSADPGGGSRPCLFPPCPRVLDASTNTVANTLPLPFHTHTQPRGRSQHGQRAGGAEQRQRRPVLALGALVHDGPGSSYRAAGGHGLQGRMRRASYKPVRVGPYGPYLFSGCCSGWGCKVGACRTLQ